MLRPLVGVASPPVLTVDISKMSVTHIVMNVPESEEVEAAGGVHELGKGGTTIGSAITDIVGCLTETKYLTICNDGLVRRGSVNNSNDDFNNFHIKFAREARGQGPRQTIE